MTIEEMIDNLQQESQSIEAQYPAALQSLGWQLDRNRESRTCWPVEEKLRDIDKLRSRQNDIARLCETLRQELARIEKRQRESA